MSVPKSETLARQLDQTEQNPTMELIVGCRGAEEGITIQSERVGVVLSQLVQFAAVSQAVLDAPVHSQVCTSTKDQTGHLNFWLVLSIGASLSC